MACYKKFDSSENLWIEQNIWDNNELMSYDANYIIEGTTKTACLYYYQDNKTNERFYSLGLKENLDGLSVTIVYAELSDILKFKTAKARRNYIFGLIRENELKIAHAEKYA